VVVGCLVPASIAACQASFSEADDAPAGAGQSAGGANRGGASHGMQAMSKARVVDRLAANAAAGDGSSPEPGHGGAPTVPATVDDGFAGGASDESCADGIPEPAAFGWGGEPSDEGDASGGQGTGWDPRACVDLPLDALCTSGQVVCPERGDPELGPDVLQGVYPCAEPYDWAICQAVYPSSCGGFSLRTYDTRYVETEYVWHFDAGYRLVGAIAIPRNQGPGCKARFYGEQCRQTGGGRNLCSETAGSCRHSLDEYDGGVQKWQDVPTPGRGVMPNDCGGHNVLPHQTGDAAGWPFEMYSFNGDGVLVGVQNGRPKVCPDGTIGLSDLWGTMCETNGIGATCDVNAGGCAF
jgi:hypothetical protein